MRKLDETRYKLNSELEETEKLEDTDIVPAGTVSKVHIACFIFKLRINYRNSNRHILSM